MDSKITINALNELIEINNDRIVGYETATKESTDTDLHYVFGRFILTSEKNNVQLREAVVKLGATVETGTKITGKLHRLWMDFKATFSENDRASILSSCVFGDEAAVKTYKDVLQNNLENLDATLQSMIMEQQNAIEKELAEMSTLENIAA